MNENYVNEQIVMQFYIEQLDADNIEFLKGKETKKAKIRGLVSDLLNEDTMNGKIQIACNLWKTLFDAALSYLSSNKTGYDKIFKFFDAYVEFEELIFASDSFYRDHTLHCIWVYFLGEYFRKNKKFEPLFFDMKNQRTTVLAISKIVEGAETLTPSSKRKLEKIERILERGEKFTDAIFCVSAITHDLGYPLKKIEKINKSIKKVLPYFAVNNFNDFSFEYNNIQQEFISDFIDCISRDFSVNIFENLQLYDDAAPIVRAIDKVMIRQNSTVIGFDEEGIRQLTQEEKDSFAEKLSINAYLKLDNPSKNAFLNDFENYQHGIMSAFVLMKNLGVFQGISYSREDKLDLNADRQQTIEEVLALIQILQAITVHTSEGFTISEIGDTSFLTFVDELEEFSRISRASQNREYVKEFCETYLDFDEEGWLNITFEFHNDNLDNLDPEISFKGRCKRFLALFDIANMSANLKLRVSCVGKLETDQNTYVLEIANHHADIIINGESQNIPKYLKATQFYTKEEYAEL